VDLLAGNKDITKRPWRISAGTEKTERKETEMNEYDATEQAYMNGYWAGRSSTFPMKVVVEGCIPTRAHANDAGLDLYSTESRWIFPKSRAVLGTGLHVAIPKGWVGMLTSKSGLMMRGVTSRGTIDSDYTGEIKAILFNHSWKFIRIKKGQKITQLVLMPIVIPEMEVVSRLESTDRGNGGFGSTGNF
jgi:dUTP pyrophosphatase